MPTKIIDLSTVLGKPLEVRFAPDGPVYKVPADIPVPLYLKVQEFAQLGDEADEEAAVRELYAELLALFRVYQPELDSLPVSIGQLVEAIPRIFGGDEPDPPKAKASPNGKGGTRSTKPKRTKKSASSTPSAP